MNKKILKTETICFFIVLVVGSLFHFLFKLSNQNTLVALFSPINESIWEHLKMLWFPYIFTSFFEKKFIKSESFFFSKLCGGIVGIASIVIFFYTYSTIVGKHFLFMDIVCFILGVFLAFLTSYKIIEKQNENCKKFETVSIFLIIAVSILFFVFTFAPPKTEIFRDSTNDTYSIYKTNQ